MTAMREGAARQYPLGGIHSAEQVADVMAFLLGDGATPGELLYSLKIQIKPCAFQCLERQ
jgi:hypothetical protein